MNGSMKIEINEIKNPEKEIKTLLEISRNDGSHPVGEWWLQRLLKEDVVVFLTSLKDLPVGFVVVSKWFKYDKCGIELDVISVRKEWQGKGIGTMLMKKVFDLAKQLNKDFVYLFVSAENHKALSFYNKFGFEMCGILADRYGEGRHSIIMRAEVKS